MTDKPPCSCEFGMMLGKSQAMQKVFEVIGHVSATDAGVLITGEPGTGRELAARTIHQAGMRREKPFVSIDCGAIPETLFEHEFFGHETGSRTGSGERIPGLLEVAQGGTVYLEEVESLPLSFQPKLLRALQEQAIRRVGSIREINIDVRVIASTSVDLESEIRAKRFRLGLYYRINVARIDMPPLRHRKGDIALLAESLLIHYASRIGRPDARLSSHALDRLTAYSWPGNVRELQNFLQRVLAQAHHDRIEVKDLPDPVAPATRSVPDSGQDGFFAERERRVTQFERDYFLNLLVETHGDVSTAARRAQVPRGTLYRLLKNHSLDPAEFRRE